jgi:hypothetical protein
MGATRIVPHLEPMSTHGVRPRVMMGRHVLGTEAKEVFCCWIKKVGIRLKQIKMFMEQQYNLKFKSIEKMKVLANK